MVGREPIRPAILRSTVAVLHALTPRRAGQPYDGIRGVRGATQRSVVPIKRWCNLPCLWGNGNHGDTTNTTQEENGSDRCINVSPIGSLLFVVFVVSSWSNLLLFVSVLGAPVVTSSLAN